MNSLVIYFVGSLLRILQFMFFARAIMSWFVQGSDSKIYEFLCLVTEPVIQPFRSLLSRVSALRNCPFDFAFMLAFFVLIVLEQMVYICFKPAGQTALILVGRSPTIFPCQYGK